MEEISGDDLGNEEWESDCDDEEEAGLISKLALGVDATEIGNYDGKSTPINGSQYLLSVIMEAKKSPKVVVADMKAIESTSANISSANSKTEDIIEENKLNPVFLPTSDWQTQIITEFSELRSKIDCKRSLIELGKVKFDHPQMPEKGNVILWFKYCFGTEVANAITNQSKKVYQNPQADLNTIPEDFFVDLRIDNCQVAPVDVEIKEENEESDNDEPLKSDATTNVGSRPLMRIMLCLSQRLVEFLITCHLAWLKKYGLFNVRQGEWIYALLTCVQKPLEPSIVSDIRSICKLCISLRSKFCDFKSENGETVGSSLSLSDKELEYLNTLNLFICIISNYFGQSDLIL